MGAVVSITNQKGGVGKTVTVSSLGSILTSQGYKVLLIDLDPQRNLDMVAGKNTAIPPEDEVTKCILHVLRGECSLEEAVFPCVLGDLVRASSLLSQWTGRHLITRDEAGKLTKEEIADLVKARFDAGWGSDTDVLKSELDKIRDKYDYILIDTNPSLMLLTLNSLYAADYVLIPAFAEEASRDAIRELWDTIQNINLFRPWKQLRVMGILRTKYVPRNRVSKSYTNRFVKMAAAMNTVVFNQTIRQSVSVSEYMTNRTDLLRFDPDGNASKDYLAFTEEFKSRINEMEGI